MIDILHREFVSIWYYFDVQLRQIFPYWVLGMALGSAVSVFAKKIHDAERSLSGRKLAAGFSCCSISDDWLAASMMSFVLLNPQLIIYSAALETTALVVRMDEEKFAELVSIALKEAAGQQCMQETTGMGGIQ